MSTLSLAAAIEPAIRTALLPMAGGYYRTEDSNGDALIPSWWVHADSSAGINDWQDIAIVSVDIWHESLGDLNASLSALEFLRDWRVHGVGTYSRQSVSIQHEEQNVHHAVILLAATHVGVIA